MIRDSRPTATGTIVGAQLDTADSNLTAGARKLPRLRILGILGTLYSDPVNARELLDIMKPPGQYRASNDPPVASDRSCKVVDAMAIRDGSRGTKRCRLCMGGIGMVGSVLINWAFGRRIAVTWVTFAGEAMLAA
jgi:hypothetical protein